MPIWIAGIEGTVFAVDLESVSSPDKQFTVAFPDRQTFSILDARGKIMVASRDLPGFSEVVEFRPEHTSWSPDGQILAVAGGGGHDLKTFIFARHGSSFASITVPNLTGKYDNAFVTPRRWLKGHRLVLDISGPHAGKANGYFYRGRATIRILITPFTCEVHYNRITEHNDS